MPSLLRTVRTFRLDSPIRRLAAARLISIAGGETAFIALIALVYARTGSPVWASVTLLATVGVHGLAAPLGGLLGDRFDRRRVMIGSDLGAAACFAVLPFLHSPVAIIAVAGLAAAAESAFLPSSSAAVPNLAGSEGAVAANATIATAGTLGFLIGPLTGGVLVASVGAGPAFALNAASFVVSALLVSTIGGSFAGERSDAAEHGGLTAGFRFIAGDVVLRTVVVAWCLFVLGVGVILVADLPLAKAFGMGEVGYGLLCSAWALGSLFGSVAARQLLPRRGELPSLVGGALVMSIFIGLVGVLPWFTAILAASLAGGVGNGIANIAEETLFQKRAPDAVRSRAISASSSLILALMGLSFAAGGLLVEALGPQHCYLICAVTGLLGTAAAANVLRRPAHELELVGA